MFARQLTSQRKLNSKGSFKERIKLTRYTDTTNLPDGRSKIHSYIVNLYQYINVAGNDKINAERIIDLNCDNILVILV